MSTTSIVSTTNAIPIDPDQLRFFPIQFGMFLSLFIVNIPCSIFYLYYSFTHVEYRQALYNQGMIIFIIINIFYQCTNNIFFMYYFHNFGPMSSTREFRLVWGYFDWMLMLIQSFLFAWICIERHILIFHDRLVATKRGRIMFHYLPLVMVLAYGFLYYTLIIFAPSCESIDLTSPNPTFDPCIFKIEILHSYEMIVHQIGCVVIIVISSIILLIRIARQEFRVQQHIRWRRHRRMAIQLLSVSFLYLVLPTPYILVFLLNIFGVARTYAADVTKYYLYLGYYIFFLQPVVCVGTLSTVSRKMKKWILSIITLRPF